MTAGVRLVRIDSPHKIYLKSYLDYLSKKSLNIYTEIELDNIFKMIRSVFV